MSCCAPLLAADAVASEPGPAPRLPQVDPAFVQQLGGGLARLDLLVPGMHCASCLSTIERAVGALPSVTSARANLTAGRVRVEMEAATADPDAVLAAVEGQGYAARPFDAGMFNAAESDEVGGELIRAMAVAGFAAGNIMLLSVSVWSGADAATRDFFHWVSALIALPTVVYAGRPFFRSAWRGIRARSVNMDVPISLGVILAAAMSLYETATHGEHAWFDASVSLLFFLLVGRFLDHRMRDVARSAAARLMSLSARSALRLEPDGSVAHVPIDRIAPGDLIRIAAGERVPVDGVVINGTSDIDRSMLTGEAEPEPVGRESRTFAGTLNLTGPLTVQAAARSRDTLLADIVRLMESAERSDSRFVRLADRAARRYAPAVHALALSTLVGWLAVGAGWHAALTACVAVLIITCPCALGLAVPAVQIVASGYLLRRGVMLKDGAALEKLSAVGTVVLDKTGTLTEGYPVLVDAPDLGGSPWSAAAALGAVSRHPLARALAKSAADRGISPAALSSVREVPGSGMEGECDGVTLRLGRKEWVGGAQGDGNPGCSEIWLRFGQAPAVLFTFRDAVRPDAAETVRALKQLGLSLRLLSGDRSGAVSAAARQAGIEEWRSGCLPGDKARILSEMEARGEHVLMVGDGINDAPALACASVSMSPANASEISQAAADIVFTGRRLAPILTAIRTARAARRMILQNFALAIAYNVLAVPIAMLGLATPLIAAVAMSSSSIIVTANALRLPLSLRIRENGPGTLPLAIPQESAA